MDVDGTVPDVEQNTNGGYLSCAPVVDTSPAGCEYEQLGWTDYVVWNWANQEAASKVPSETLLVAQCTVSGLQSGNLILNGCSVIDVPSQDQQQQQQAFCNSLLNGITVTDLKIDAPKSIIRSWTTVNMTMTVHNNSTQPVGLAGADVQVAIGNSYLSSEPVAIYTSSLVNASSQLTFIGKIQEASYPSYILAGDQLRLTLNFGQGTWESGGYSISGSCGMKIVTTAVLGNN
jgi:hypothetical protein